MVSISNWTTDMWNWLIFINLLLASHLSWAQRAVTCQDPVYIDCFRFCDDNCNDNYVDCVHNCEHGCGCMEGYIVRNNGACLKLNECVFEDLTSEELETPPTPCTNDVDEVSEANGDYRPNLLPFKPFNRFV